MSRIILKWQAMYLLLTFVLTAFTGGCTEQHDPILYPEASSEQVVDPSENDQSIDSDDSEAQHLVIPPWIDRQEVMDIAINDLGLTDDELIDFKKILDDGYTLGEQVPQGMLEGDDIAPGLTKTTCSNQRHYYLGSCQDGVVPWGPCDRCTTCDHDWRMIYQRSMSGWGWQGSGWYYVPLNPNAVTATIYYRAAYSSDKYTEGGVSKRWMMMGDRGVSILFGGSVDVAATSYINYQQLCR